MPYSDIGQGLMAAGGAFAEAMKQRRALKWKEDQLRYKALLDQLQGKAASGSKELSDYPDLQKIVEVDPSQLPNVINTAQERKKMEKAQADQGTAQAQYREAAGVGTEFGPTSPSTEREADVYSKATPNEQMTLLQNLQKMRSQPPPDIQGNATMFGVDPRQLHELINQGMPIPAALDKLKEWGNQSKDPQTRKWENDVAVRQRAMDLQAAGKNDEANALLLKYGLSLAPSGVITEKDMRTRYSAYAKAERNRREHPGFEELFITGAFSAPDADKLRIVQEKLGPVQPFAQWLASPEATQLNPDLSAKLAQDEQARIGQILQDWQLTKVDGTTPDEYIDMLKRSDDYKGHLDENTIAYIRSLLQ